MAGVPLSWSVSDLSASAFLATDARATREELETHWRALFTEPILEHHDPDVREDSCWVEGERSLSQMILQSRSGRMDLLFRFPVTADPDLRKLFSFERQWEEFQPVAREWLRRLGPLRRLAIGGQLFHPFAETEAMWTALRELLPIRIGKDAADLVYQVNRWSQYSLSDRDEPPFCLNRIARWSVVELALRDRDLSRVRVPGCTLVLDLNTDARRAEPLPSDRLEGILSELAASGFRISREGDRVEQP